jgi:(1->4)-alpha-D-glucan 1-alpha-D-glucosylmutase
MMEASPNAGRPRRYLTDSDCTALAARVAAKRRRPIATYRLQFSPALSFDSARQLVDYLRELGISDVYASPLLKASPRSSHGYDIIDHGSLNPVLGSEEDFNRFVGDLRRKGLGLILDIVPNHMGVADPANTWWMDVLENGPSSPYAAYFDIDWNPLAAGTNLENRLLLPILGDPYGKVLEGQELRLVYADGGFSIIYADHRMPIALRSYARILSRGLEDLISQLGPEHAHVLELQSIITAIGHLPPETETEPEKVVERQREKEIIKRRLASLVDASPLVRARIEETVASYNGKPGDPRSFDALDALLDEQCYRLAYWRVATEEINYRRFFDINELAAIRAESPQVFDETHRLVLRLVREGKVTGLRVDHVDGLWDPRGYLRRLQGRALLELCRELLDRRFGEAPERAAAEQDLLAWFERRVATSPHAPESQPFYIVVEKILGVDEALPPSWPVAGTTGYDFANLVNGLFVDPQAQRSLTRLYTSFVHLPPLPFSEVVNSTKKIIMLISLASEVNRLSHQLKRIAARNRWYRDLTLNSLTYAIREVIAALPIYRTYVTEDDDLLDSHDRRAIEEAVAEARRRNPRTAAAIFDFIRRVLCLELPEDAGPEEQLQWRRFVMRFQQTTGPVMAKGVEDTAFYVYNRLLSLNEVGAHPDEFGISPSLFHQKNLERYRSWPEAMLTISTHDSKRSADVRARLNVLSELPLAWRAAVLRWSRLNRPQKRLIGNDLAPDRNEEYYFYQTLLGTWPLDLSAPGSFDAFRARIRGHMLKALREAKVHTNWVNPSRAYEDAVLGFIDDVLGGPLDVGFLRDFQAFSEIVSFFGMINSLSQMLLLLTAPGVPDIYQGDELWNFSLVDPDNRRPVDFARRRSLLSALDAQLARVHRTSVDSSADGARPGEGTIGQRETLRDLAAELLRHWRDGRIKLFLVRTALAVRRRNPDVFLDGEYRGLDATGAYRNHLVAVERSNGRTSFLAVVPRLVVSVTGEATIPPIGDIWQDTALPVPDAEPCTRYRNLFTDEIVTAREFAGRATLRVAEILSSFPVALLQRLEGREGKSCAHGR